MAWVGLRIEGSGVSGNPLGVVTSVIQFDDLMAMAGLCSVHWEWGGLNREQWIPPALLYRESLTWALILTMSPCKSLVRPVHS